MKRILATALSAALIMLSPGPFAWEAAAAAPSGKTGKSGGKTGTGTTLGSTAAPLPALSLPQLSLQPAALGPAGVTPTPGVSPTADAPQAAAPNAASPASALPAQIAAVPVAQAPLAPALAPTVGAPAAAPAAPQAPAVQQGLATMNQSLQKIGQSEPIKELSSEKGDKGSALGRLFDKARKGSGEEAGVQGREAAKAGAGLKAAGPTQLTEPGQVPKPAAEKKKPGLIERIRTNFNLSEFNKSEKSYIMGQAVFLFAISVYLASLPLLVKALTGDAAMTGVARAVHYWVFGGASLFAGAVVDRTPMKRILVGAAGTRALIFGTIGVLGLMGGLPWVGFLALVGVNALIVSMNHLVDIDTGGAAKIFGSDKKIEKAGYVYDFIYYGMMLIVPPLIGIPMDWLDGRFGPGLGAAAGFAVFAALMGVTATIYAKRVHIIGEKAALAAAAVGGLMQRAWGAVKTFARIIVEMPARNIRVFKVMWKNKAIMARSSMATVENFVEDALFAVVLPTFAIDVLRVGAFGNGMLLSAITAGGLMASTILMSRAQKIQKKIGLYRFLQVLTVGASLAFIPSIALWAVPSIWMAIPAVLAMKFLYQPLRSRMRALLQTAIKNDPEASKISSDIYSLMTFTEVIAAGAGGLAFSWLFTHGGDGSALTQLLGQSAPMKAVSLALVGVSMVYLLGLKWVKKQIHTPTMKVHESKPGDEQKAYEKLAMNLEKLGLPPAKQIKVAEKVSSDAPTVAILAPASTHKLSMAREGGRQAPGDVHLVLDPSWLIQENWQDQGSRLYMKKGLYFDAEGKAVIAEYEHPRPVRYFANFYTLGANDRDDGVPLEKNLDVPQSNSVQLEAVTNEKLLTRLLLAAKGVSVPATVAFLMAAHPLNSVALPSSDRQTVFTVPMPGESDRAGIRASLERFLETYKGEEVVVKPSGPQFHSGRGVKFFPRADVEAMVDHVIALSKDEQMTADGAVLVDSRLVPPALYLRTGTGDGSGRQVHLMGKLQPFTILAKTEIAGARPKEKKDWNFRVLVARTPWDGAAVTGIFARAGAWGLPTNAEPANPEDAAAVMSFDDVVLALQKQHGLLTTPAEIAEFRAELDRVGHGAMQALAENEAKRVREDGESRQAQSDYIGLDVMVEIEDGKPVAKIIEINDHDSGGQWNLDTFTPQTPGGHSREWVANMLQRARRDALKGKRIVIVGAGYEGKRFIFERAQELGVKVVLVDKGFTGLRRLVDQARTLVGLKSRDHWARGLVDEFIVSDNAKPAEALARAKDKLLRSARKNGKIDGITTFWEDDVPLTADIAKELGLPYHTQAAAKSVRSKAETRRVMKEAGLPTPRFAYLKIAPHPSDETLKTAKAKLEEAIKTVGFPAVLKPAFGAAAQGVKRVDSPEEARAAFDEMIRVFSQDSIFEQGWDMVLDQYLDGPEYDVDVVMQGGEARFVSVTDNWPTREPYFLATGSSLPSVLPKNQQAEVESLAVATAKALGLTDGVVHIEGKYTKEGARIIEANGRMGGVYVRDWVKAVWGVDLVEENLLAAGGIPAAPFKPSKPLTYLEGEFLIPQKSGLITAFALPDDAREAEGFHELRQMKKAGDRLAVPPKGFERAGMLVAKGADRNEALKNLDGLRARLVLDIADEE